MGGGERFWSKGGQGRNLGKKTAKGWEKRKEGFR